MIDLKDDDRSSTAAPVISLRLACTVLLLAGLLVLAHGCHGDEDNELWNLACGVFTSSQP
jgi:hypothetical protein